MEWNKILKKQDMLTGALFYTMGDTVAALISDEFSWLRVVGLMFIGGVLYAIEIPAYFRLINRLTASMQGFKGASLRMLLSMAWFNPIWIARHMIMIKILLLQFDTINWGILSIAWSSFLWNIPISMIANYVIQNVIAEKYRFLANAIFSGMMAVYYALSATWFA